MVGKSIGIIGYGHFGQFLHTVGRRFLPDCTIRVYSKRAAIDNHTFFDLETAAQSDIVILCGSISDYETQLVSVLPHTRPDTILVDVATVKKYTSELFKSHGFKSHGVDRPYICTHPMFGPESYKKQGEEVTGFRIVVTDHTLPIAQYLAVTQALTRLGFVLIETTADQHDQHLARTLFLTHYIGQTMHQAGFDRTPIDTISFSYLMNAVESVKDDGKLFADVYRYNPYCQEVSTRFHATQQRILGNLEHPTT